MHLRYGIAAGAVLQRVGNCCYCVHAAGKWDENLTQHPPSMSRKHMDADSTRARQQSLQAIATHPRFPRRTAIQAGSIGLLGLGMNHVAGLRALADESSPPVPSSPARKTFKAVIYIFLSGGLTQHDSFDPKPEAP